MKKKGLARLFLGFRLKLFKLRTYIKQQIILLVPTTERKKTAKKKVKHERSS